MDTLVINDEIFSGDRVTARLWFRLLGKLRQLGIHVIPGLCTGSEKIHARFEAARIVQTARGNQHESRHSGRLTE